LHVACEWNSLEMVELLWERGGEALVMTKNGEGMDAMDYAYAENMEQPYRLLREKMGLEDRWIMCSLF